MLIDLLILLIIALLVLIGIVRGAIRQIIGLAGVTAGVILATRFYAAFSKVILKIHGLSVLKADLISWLVMSVVIYIIIKVLGFFLEKKPLVKGMVKGKLDKILGGFFGGLKALVMIMIIVFLADVLVTVQLMRMDQEGLQKSGRSVAEKAAGSIHSSLIASNLIKHNPFKEFKLAKGLNYYAQLQNKPGELKKLAQREDVKKLLENKKIQALVEDEKLQKALADKNYAQLLNNEKILEIMNDKELRELLLSVNFDEILKEEETEGGKAP
ncbi:MAG: CvpA family protein [bacterium]